MPGAHLSEEQRLHLITLYAELKNVTHVAEELKIERATVRCWLRRFQQEGNVKRKRQPGPQRLLDDNARTVACEALVTGQCTTRGEAARLIHHNGLTSHVVPHSVWARASLCQGL